MKHCGQFDGVVEVGSGAGQAAALLAYCGVPTVGIETQPQMLELFAKLKSRLVERVDPKIEKYLTLMYDFFPRKAETYLKPGQLLCFISISHSMSAEEEAKLYATIAQADGVIIGLTHFFVPRQTVEERKPLIERICKHGFNAPLDIYPTTEWVRNFTPNHIVFFPKPGFVSTKRKGYDAVFGNNRV
jgi:SAM-dependent methyltransferase